MYHDLVTEKSFQVLQNFKRQYAFVLIGGWAAYLYTKGLKSRDIDFICDYQELQKLKAQYELVKNDRLKKYEIHMGEFDVDIYLPFYSDLGIPVDDLIKMTRLLDGFEVLEPEALLILKQNAYHDRQGSTKGEKDRLDIISLLNKGPVDIKKYTVLMRKYGLKNYADNLRKLLKDTREAPELGIGEHSFSRLKRRILADI